MGQTKKRQRGIFPLDAGPTKRAKNSYPPEMATRESLKENHEPVPNDVDVLLGDSLGKRFQVGADFKLCLFLY